MNISDYEIEITRADVAIYGSCRWLASIRRGERIIYWAVAGSEQLVRDEVARYLKGETE